MMMMIIIIVIIIVVVVVVTIIIIIIFIMLNCALLFRLAHVDGLTGGTMVRLRSEAIERYRVDYVAGFRSAGFSYFLTNQRDKFDLVNAGLLPTVSGELTSRIIQASSEQYMHENNGDKICVMFE